MIGLIGEIGGGKSQTASLLSARGAFVLDADAVGHALLNQTPVREQVIDRFGPEIVSAASEGHGSPPIDRKALGAIVFARPEALRELEAILHPRMRRTFERAIAREERRGQATAVVLDAAILLEAGWDSLCDRVVFVEAPRTLRLERVNRDRGWSDETLSRREAAQWPSEKKRERADSVIVNDGGLDGLEAAVNRFWGALSPEGRPRVSNPSGGPRKR